MDIKSNLNKIKQRFLLEKERCENLPPLTTPEAFFHMVLFTLKFWIFCSRCGFIFHDEI